MITEEVEEEEGTTYAVMSEIPVLLYWLLVHWFIGFVLFRFCSFRFLLFISFRSFRLCCSRNDENPTSYLFSAFRAKITAIFTC